MCFIQRLFSGAMQCRHRPGYRLIWILDEYQRIEALPKRVRDEINSSLHSVFNTCPTGLSLLLSFSGKPEPGNLPPWLTPELKSRISENETRDGYAMAWDGPDDRMIFIQSQNKKTHGLGDASFVTAPGRNASILNSVAGKEIYRIDHSDRLVALR